MAAGSRTFTARDLAEGELFFFPSENAASAKRGASTSRDEGFRITLHSDKKSKSPVFVGEPLSAAARARRPSTSSSESMDDDRDGDSSDSSDSSDERGSIDDPPSDDDSDEYDGDLRTVDVDEDFHEDL